MSIIVYDNKYLCDDLTFSENIMKAATIHIEFIADIGEYKLVRMIINGKYISMHENNMILDDNFSDNSLLYLENKKLDIHLHSIGGMLTCRDDRLSIEDFELSKMDWYTNRLKLRTDSLAMLVNNGITSIQSSNDLDSVAKLIHNSPHTRISNLFELNFDLFWKILNDSELHKILRAIYPNGYHCTTYSSNNLRKNVNEVGWHCDYPYHNISESYPDEMLGVQVIWTLDDFTVENGATYFVPKSHKKNSWPDITTATLVQQAVIKRNNIIIFFGTLWHTQGINTTDIPRAALLANFSPLSVPVKDNINTQISNEYLKNGKLLFQ